MAGESAADVSSTLPVLVYVVANETSAGDVIVQLMPSIKSLQNNELCRLGSTDQLLREMFAVQQTRTGLSSVVLTRAINNHLRRRYQLSIICEPILGTAQPPFVVYLHVHVL